MASESILLVDDEKNIREFISLLLNHYNFDVTEAVCGNDALELIKKNTYSLILSDIKMPNGDGLDLLNGIKDLGIKTPVIMMTGYADDFIEKINQHKIHCILNKPIKADTIVETIQDALKTKNNK